MQKYLIVLLLSSVFLAGPVSATRHCYTVNPARQTHTHEGWGVSLCWWANVCGQWSDRQVDELIDWLVSPEGLGYSVFRYNIGGGDDPSYAHCDEHHFCKGKGCRAEMEGFKDSTHGAYVWTRDSAQRRVMLKIREKCPDAVFEAFSNSAPYYMTYSGCCGGAVKPDDDNLKPEYYEEFARYLVDVCRYYKEEHGIEFQSLEPFNEPSTDYWYANGSQEGCHFSPSSQVAFLKVLAPLLKASGLSTFISAADESVLSHGITSFKTYADAGVLDLIGRWNNHTYHGDNAERSQLSRLVREAGLKLWMSETGDGGHGLEGNLKVAQRLIDDERYLQPDAWVDWQYVEEGNDQWCLVKADFARQTYRKVKNYSVRRQFTSFIRKGYRFLDVDDRQTLAAVSPAGDTLVLVSLNASRSHSALYEVDLTACRSLGGCRAYLTDSRQDVSPTDFFTFGEGRLSFVLQPLSVVTFVIPLAESKRETVE